MRLISPPGSLLVIRLLQSQSLYCLREMGMKTMMRKEMVKGCAGQLPLPLEEHLRSIVPG
jgi:hypothetical protein